jgi:hypothetical protein
MIEMFSGMFMVFLGCSDRQIHKEYRQSREFKRKFAEQVDKDSKIKRIYR